MGGSVVEGDVRLLTATKQSCHRYPLHIHPGIAWICHSGELCTWDLKFTDADLSFGGLSFYLNLMAGLTFMMDMDIAYYRFGGEKSNFKIAHLKNATCT